MQKKFTLWITEKPSVAKAFAEVMGCSGNMNHQEGAFISSDSETKITWAVGHLLKDAEADEYDEKYKRWTLSELPIIPKQWIKKPIERTASQLSKVTKLIASASKIVLATDYDREGEVIGRELLEKYAYRGPVSRVNIVAMDSASLKKCIENEFDGALGLPLYQAGVARAQADWLVGINLTRAATLFGREKGVDGVLSAGRVQSAVLKLIVDREKEITTFTSRDHYQLRAMFSTEDATFSGRWLPPVDLLSPDKLLLDIEPVSQRAGSLKGQTATVMRCTAKDAYENPPLPFSLSAAQIECSKKFGFSGDDTLNILQALYDKKLLSYPRTDCRHIPTGQLTELDDTLKSLRIMNPQLNDVIDGLDKSRRSAAWDDSKIGAHYALMPTPHCGDLSELNTDQRKVYDLIIASFLAQFMAAAKYRDVNLEIRAGDDIFVSSGSTLLENGWLEFVKPINEEDDDQEEICSLPELPEGTVLQIADTEIVKKATTPPKRYTDASLIAIMTNCASLVKDPQYKKILKNTAGIGTEATRAGIIKTLFSRNYVVRRGKSILPTSLGSSVVSMLPPQITGVENTAWIEQQLEAVASRQLSPETFRADIENMLRDIFERGFPDFDATALIAAQSVCPSCGKKLNRRSGVNGFFWGCSGYPECKTTFPDKKGKPEFSKNKKSGKGKK